MLEGAVARLLNQLLGKYVCDLDTENLNVGIFSGLVQLTDLKLKSEALYELKLPIQVKAGTIGKITLKIPWSALWSQPVIVHIEDVHIIATPITSPPYDPAINKSIVRAYKRKLLADLVAESNQVIGGPENFSQHLLTNIVNNLQLNVANVHLRYEDDVNADRPFVIGVCVGNIQAEATNCKWKASKPSRSAEQPNNYYLIKLEAFCIYCNTTFRPIKWNLPADYYQWRNTMSASLQNYSINAEDFDFLIRPMSLKIKMTLTHNTTSGDAKLSKISNDIVVHDLNIQLSKQQYATLQLASESFSRMLIGWQYLHLRSSSRWQYAYHGVIEQRIRPYTWRAIKSMRECYKRYVGVYKQYLLNPNDTELRMDLQQYEDRLTVENIVLARQQAKLIVDHGNVSEKTFWDVLSSPERENLCDQIAYDRKFIDYIFNFRLGNTSVTLLNNQATEILVVTLTQIIGYYQPSSGASGYKGSVKVEGVIVEGASVEDHLVPILSSDHNGRNAPAYFFKLDVEKLDGSTTTATRCKYRIGAVLEYLELAYNKHSFDEIETFFGAEHFTLNNAFALLNEYPQIVFRFLHDKLIDNWDFTLDVKVPYLILPENGSLQTGETMLVIDLGAHKMTTELCQTDVEQMENVTQIELDELMYSRLHFTSTGIQALYCDNGDLWREARKERDTDLHIIPKINWTGSYSACCGLFHTLPKHKINFDVAALKLNLNERKLLQFLRFLNGFESQQCENPVTKTIMTPLWTTDLISCRITKRYLMELKGKVTLNGRYDKSSYGRGKLQETSKYKSQSRDNNPVKENMNEVWARCVDLPGLEDNISPNNTIGTILRLVVNECQVVFSKSTDCTDRQYLTLRLGMLAIDVAWMTYGPAYQLSLGSLILTDKLHTTSSGQYLDMIYSPFPSNVDVVTILYRKVAANCPDFWTHFHGVETSLVADFGTVHCMLHQEAFHTIIKYTKYLHSKFVKLVSPYIVRKIKILRDLLKTFTKSSADIVPVPTGSVKFSHSARMNDLNVRICDSDFDIVNCHLSGFEVDFLFRANERFVFRSFLSRIDVEHLSDVTLYNKVLYSDEDKVYEVKYVRYASSVCNLENDHSPDTMDTNGKFKFYLGQLHVIFLYKLVVQLHRFIVNLEALPYLQLIYRRLSTVASAAIDTLRTCTKIHLAIDLKGPALLIPQKTSSPNVIILDTGRLTVENFFKDYANSEAVENILVKLNDIVLSRGVMTLTRTLEMQETIIEHVNLHMDIKRLIRANKTINWDIDGMIDSINVTLGQKDLHIFLAIYTDNIGEESAAGKFNDFLMTSSCNVDNHHPDDETVKTLEAFFNSEPKQKYVAMKIAFDSLNLSLFFDSGELLSSPIRDLNHGLCKFVIGDVNTSFVLYTDASLDGKLAIDDVRIEEIGLDVSQQRKYVLVAPQDDNRNNNNTHIQVNVNKPPIIDVTFHTTKSSDVSLDIIIGRLSFTTSLPFCEKLCLFVIDSIPSKDTSHHPDIGCHVNHGYIGEVTHDVATVTKQSSLTLSLRINRPECVFFVDSERSFITRAEILCDYSHHASRINFVLSLSGLHTSFDHISILKQCDFELSKSSNDSKGVKISMSISALYLQFTNRVFYALNDILSEIAEHFKVIDGTIAVPTTVDGGENVMNLWEAKKMSDDGLMGVRNIDCQQNNKTTTTPHDVPPPAIHEVYLLPKTEIVIIFDLDDAPAILIKSTIELNVFDWSSLLSATCELTLQANYFNQSLHTWEPIIDPVTIDEGGGEESGFRPWECYVRVFQDKAQVMLMCQDGSGAKSKEVKAEGGGENTEDEEEGDEDDMVFLQPTNGFHGRQNRRVKTSLSTFLDDSDSENEDGSVEKLAAAISDLFTGDWNESETSDCESSSSHDDDDDDSNNDSTAEQHSSSKPKPNDFNTITTTTGATYTTPDKKSTYFLIDAKDTLHITFTPTLLKVFDDVYTSYANKTLSINNRDAAIAVVNDIGPYSRVELFENPSSGGDGGNGGKNNNDIDDVITPVLITSKTYEKEEDSCPSSPARSVIGGYNATSDDFFIDDKSSVNNDGGADFELGYDFETINSLDFPAHTTTHLYNKINRHFLKIHVPGFHALQTSCPRRSGAKLLRLQAVTATGPAPAAIYYALVQCTIGKRGGRSVVVSSPLQIKNETCFALSVLYQPSVLQQLNLEPVGDVTNPFETTMRIAVLEPHETYNVPLYIAYHCKLFVQPAYAEGHYVSPKGIWWKDLVTEIDTPHNFHCDPKSPPTTATSKNHDVFALRVMLKRPPAAATSTAPHQHHHHHHFTIPHYVIRLLPPLVYHNFLPYPLTVETLSSQSQSQQVKIEGGDKASIYNLNLNTDQKLTLRLEYNGVVYSGVVNLTPHLDEKVVALVSDNKMDGALAVNVRSEREESCVLCFYAPYWIVNKTNLPLEFKASNSNQIYKCHHSDEIVAFTYRRHHHGRQTLQLRVYESDWSGEFGLDCPHTTGVIVCKDNERRKRYSFLLAIQPTRLCPKLSKIVTFLPCFVIVNNTARAVRFMEHNDRTDLWCDLPAGQQMAFWPETGSGLMYVKWRDSKVQSQPFAYAAADSHTVLRMDKGGALCVHITGGRTAPFSIRFDVYHDGDAPLLIRNQCSTDVFLKVQQRDCGGGQSHAVTLLSPAHGVLYTWDEPSRARHLLWNVYNNKGVGFAVDVERDGYGEEKISLHTVIQPPTTNNPATATVNQSSSDDDSDSENSSSTTHTTNTATSKIRRDKLTIYWIVYTPQHSHSPHPNHMAAQKTLMFTENQAVYEKIIRGCFMEMSDVEVLLSLSNVTLSIFTGGGGGGGEDKGMENKEHVYVGVTDLPAIWEVNVGHKWKTLTIELATWIEDKYRSHYKKCQLKDYVHIDFERMFMLKPFFAELRRSYTPAVYMQYRKSHSYQSIRMKLYDMHIANHHADSHESVVLSPLHAGLPSNYSSSHRRSSSHHHPSNFPSSHHHASPLPFIDIHTLKHQLTSATIYKNVDVAMRDVYVNVQSDLLLELSEMFGRWGGGDKGSASDEVQVEYRRDLKRVHSPSVVVVTNCKAVNQEKVVIEHLSLAPMTIQLNVLSKNQTTGSGCRGGGAAAHLISVFFPYNISPYMPVEGVRHKIGKFNVTFLHHTSLSTSLTHHLFTHFSTHLLQQYYAQVLGLHVLVNPYALPAHVENNLPTPSTTGMDDRIIYGCRCLLGHVNMSSIALEQSIVDVFNNQTLEHVQKRMLYRTPTPKSCLRSCRQFNPGVMLAVDQIIAKNQLSGVENEGELFFRGAGKALMTLIQRHPDERTDCVRVAVEAMRRAVLLGEPIRMHQRLVRYYNRHLGLKPFSIYDSMGAHLLETIANRRFAADHYWTHLALDKHGKSMIVVSLEHVLRVNKCRLWGAWDVEWCLDLDDIIAVPKVAEGSGARLVFNVRQQVGESRHHMISADGKLILEGEERVALEWLRERIEQAIVVSMEEKAWTLSSNETSSTTAAAPSANN